MMSWQLRKRGGGRRYWEALVVTSPSRLSDVHSVQCSRGSGSDSGNIGGGGGYNNDEEDFDNNAGRQQSTYAVTTYRVTRQSQWLNDSQNQLGAK